MLRPPRERPLRNRFMAATAARTSGADLAARGGTSRATGLPCLVMVISSPSATRCRSWARWVLASNDPTDSMAKLQLVLDWLFYPDEIKLLCQAIRLTACIDIPIF